MSATSTYRVLLIEDEEADFAATQEFLSKAELFQYHLDWINNYADAKERIYSGNLDYDAVLIDYFLGHQSGLDLLKSITLQGHLSPPVIMLTGHSSPEVDLEAMRSGASDYLIKEKLDTMILDRSIRYAIEHRRNEKLIMRQQRDIGSVLKMAALGEMASTITHEINNPLAVIQGRVTGILNLLSAAEINKEKIKFYAEAILGMIHRIIDIKDGLKKYYGQFEKAVYEEVTVGHLLKEAVQLCEDRIRNSGVVVHLSEIENVSLKCKPTEISQVLVNLITNACDAVEKLAEKWIWLEVQANSEDVKILVTDSGKGLSEEARGKIFSKFFTTKEKGMGIGLNLSRRIMESHFGSLEVNPKAENTQFVMVLPRKPKSMDELMYRFLVVEDEGEILQIIKDELILRGHHVETESSSLMAREKIIRGEFDAVISDVHMPDLNGIDMAKSVWFDGNKNPFFIFITGFPNATIQKALAEEKRAVLFEKPFNLKELIDRSVEIVTARRNAPLPSQKA